MSRFSLLLFLLVVTSGCGRGPAEAHPRVRLTVWAMWNGEEEKMFQKVLDRYQELHPEIQIDHLGAVLDDTKTVRAIVAGAPPDVSTLADPLYLGPLAANGALYQLDDWFHASGLREETFVPASLKLGRYRGNLYAMPFLIDDSALLWNKKAFREAGLDPERPPKTLEEFEKYVVKLTKKDSGGRLKQIGLLPPDDIYVFNRLLGGSLFDPGKSQITPDSAENVAALEWYCKMIRSMGPWEEINGFKTLGANQGSSNPFYTGQVAMTITGEWNPYWIKLYAPQLDYGVAPLPGPAAHPERTGSTWLGGNMFLIPKGSKHPREAWDLLVWMQTDEAQILFANVMHGVPNQLRILNDRTLRTGEPWRAMYGRFLDIAINPNADTFPAIPVANLYNSELLSARDTALNGDKPPAQALQDVRIRVQREMDRYK